MWFLSLQLVICFHGTPSLWTPIFDLSYVKRPDSYWNFLCCSFKRIIVSVFSTNLRAISHLRTASVFVFTLLSLQFCGLSFARLDPNPTCPPQRLGLQGRVGVGMIQDYVQGYLHVMVILCVKLHKFAINVRLIWPAHYLLKWKKLFGLLAFFISALFLHWVVAAYNCAGFSESNCCLYWW